MSSTPTIKNPPLLIARPFVFNKRTVVCLPRELVEKYSIEEELTELEIRPDNGGFFVTVKRRGDFQS